MIKFKDFLTKELLVIAVVFLLYIIAFALDSKESTFQRFLLLIAYIIAGWGVISKASKNIFKKNFFDENFLMTIATLGAILIDELHEAVMVMFLYYVGEYLQKVAVKKSRKSIQSLLEIRPQFAQLKVNGKTIRMNPSEVKVGDVVVVRPGEKIPLDGIVINGSSSVDGFALTGESIPKQISVFDTVLAGMINKSGLIEIKVTKPFNESSIAKIMHLVEFAAHKKAKTEKFITKFARVYSPIVVAIAFGVAVFPPILFSAQTFTDWIYRSLVILVVSCPCALVISIPLSYFGALGSASKRGILIKGSSYLDTLYELSTIVFDKTGTLTKGVFKVSEVVANNNFSKEEVLWYAYIAESNSNHPIADSIKELVKKESQIPNIIEQQEISGQGIKVRIENKTIIAGNDKLLHTEKIEHDICRVEGTVIHVAINGVYAGYIIISDELKDDSLHTVQILKSLGVNKTFILSGDSEYSTKIFADKLEISESYSELLPEDKLARLEEILKNNKKGKVAFVGDGINDAPVISRADVGIAMGGLGSDAAVEAADVVIMEDQPSKVAEAILIAKKTRKIVKQNVIFSLTVKLAFILLGTLGAASMWEAVFGDMGVALIAILNSTRIFKI